MDIKEAFAYVLTDKAVNRFFQELRDEYEVFGGFESLADFIHFMHTQSHLSIIQQNQCLLLIISKIQTTKNQEAGLALMTYLMSPGLQKILYRYLSPNEKVDEKFYKLWWHFFQSINKYPVLKRPQKVVLNLLLDTQKKHIQEWRQDRAWQEAESLDSDKIQKIPLEELSPILNDIRNLLQGEDNVGLTEMDKDIVISSRIYDESMQDIAERWGLQNSTAYQRRYRAEKRLNKRWS